MTCSHDGALMLEDLRFRTDMLSYRLPQRRFVCSMGHARITHVPSGEEPERVARLEGFPVLRCRICERRFESKWKAVYCSDACRALRARNRERDAWKAGTTTRQRQARANKGKGRSWRHASAMQPRVALRGTPIPQVTAARGTGGWA